MLIALRDYLQLVGSATLADLARHFDVPESAMQGMLEQWVRKGKVIVVNTSTSSCSSTCGGCTINECNSQQMWYRWQY